MITMKKLFIFSISSLFCLTLFSQNGVTEKGSFFLETGSSLSNLLTTVNIPNTGFALLIDEGEITWAIGMEAGFFPVDNLALKFGLGYSEFGDFFSIFNYKVGTKYYIDGRAPLQIDITGANIEDNQDQPLWLGIQGGYALMLGDRVALEPTFRYNVNLNNDLGYDNIVEVRMGFVFFFP